MSGLKKGLWKIVKVTDLTFNGRVFKLHHTANGSVIMPTEQHGEQSFWSESQAKEWLKAMRESDRVLRYYGHHDHSPVLPEGYNSHAYMAGRTECGAV